MTSVVLSTMSDMTASQRDADTHLFTGVDLRAFWETFRLRWWIVPTVLAVSVGFLWAQSSDAPTEPGLDLYSITRTYEARDPTAVLASVGIDPVSVRAFPDAANQLSVLQGSDIRDEITNELGRNVNVTVTRSQPSFTLIDTLETDGSSSFIFQSAGVPTYNFACTDPDQMNCETAIDAYVAKATEFRKSAFTAGLTNLQTLLGSLAPRDQALENKIAAINSLIDQLDTSFVQIAGRTDIIRPPITSVRRPTIIFSMSAGLIVSLLILLQLTITDRRLRSARQVVNEIGSATFIGAMSRDQHPTKDLLAGVSVRQACLDTSAQRVMYVPLSGPTETKPLERLSLSCDVQSRVTKPFPDLSVPEIVNADGTDLVILVAQRNRDSRQDLRRAVSALQRSGRNFGGVLLLD